MTSVFLAPTRQPTMQLPHSVQPVRAGPFAAEVGVGHPLAEASPKKTPTGVLRKLSPTPEVSRQCHASASSTGPSHRLVDHAEHAGGAVA